MIISDNLSPNQLVDKEWWGKLKNGGDGGEDRRPEEVKPETSGCEKFEAKAETSDGTNLAKVGRMETGFFSAFFFLADFVHFLSHRGTAPRHLV